MKVVDLIWFGGGKCPGLTAKGEYTGRQRRYVSAVWSTWYYIESVAVSKDVYYQYIQAQAILKAQPVNLTF